LAPSLCDNHLSTGRKRVTIFADYDAQGLSAAPSFFEHRPELEVWIATPAMAGDDFDHVWGLSSPGPEAA